MSYKEWGSEDDPNVLICVHGLTRVSDDFDVLAAALGGQFRIICPDVVGRGRSSWLCDPRHYTLPVYANDLLRLIATTTAKSVAWLGTSMGGLIGMLIASMRPSLIQKLVLNDIGPTLNPAALSRIGDYVGQQTEFATFEEAQAYIREISASFGPHDEEQWAVLTRNVMKTNEAGKWVRVHDPAIALAFQSQSDTARQQSERMLWAAYENLRCRTLLVRGKKSDLLTSETAREMTRRGPRAELVELDGVGHAPMFMHAEQIEVIARFLNS